MIRFSRLLLVVTCWLISCAYAELPSLGIAQKNPSLAPMLEKVMPAVVNISVQGEVLLARTPLMSPENQDQGQGQDQNQNQDQSSVDNQSGDQPSTKFGSLGSGVIVEAKKGYILTNAHLIKDAKIIMVALNDGRRFPGHLIGADAASDLAVIQIKAPHLTAIPFGDSDNVKVGDFVAAIGNPFGLNQTVTSGIVSGLGRTDLGLEGPNGYEDFIQTDAPINPGNSGGALVNLNGQLIGINTAILSPGASMGIEANIGIGFAIPSNMAYSVLSQLIEYGKVERGMLGVMVQDLSPLLADALNTSGTRGALVADIAPDSPAEKAGLKISDIIVGINGKPVQSAVQVRMMVGLMRVGSKVTMRIKRGNNLINIQAVTISPQQVLESPQQMSFISGLRLMDFSQLQDNRLVKGVAVLDVTDLSPAYRSGLRPGDIILAVNNQETPNLANLQKAVASNNHPWLLLRLSRESGGQIYLVVQ